MSQPAVVPIGPGAFAVTIDGRTETVYVARTTDAAWAFCRGEVFREQSPDRPAASAGASIAVPITAPMPATVRSVLIAPGRTVKKGETLLILEAMKMELPLRASSDATVTAVHCREGDLVQPERVLVELS